MRDLEYIYQADRYPLPLKTYRRRGQQSAGVSSSVQIKFVKFKILKTEIFFSVIILKCNKEECSGMKSIFIRIKNPIQDNAEKKLLKPGCTYIVAGRGIAEKSNIR